MQLLLISLIFALIEVTVALRWKESRSLSYTFADYLEEFYPIKKFSDSEYIQRKEIFLTELNRVIEHNKKVFENKSCNRFRSIKIILRFRVFHGKKG